MNKLPDERDEKTLELAIELADIAEEIQRPGYHGHGLVPRFYIALQKKLRELDSLQISEYQKVRAKESGE